MFLHCIYSSFFIVGSWETYQAFNTSLACLKSIPQKCESLNQLKPGDVSGIVLEGFSITTATFDRIGTILP
jgi:hypothetical protein